MSIQKIFTAGPRGEEWLALRRRTIGGSDAAAILGVSPWATPYTVWARKTGRLPDTPDTEAMRQGRDLEAYVARRFAEASGKRVRRENALLYNAEYPFAHADIDRRIVGENAGLECKTASALSLRDFRGGHIPESCRAQCVHYLAVTGADRWYLAVMILGQGFFRFCIERDQCGIDALMSRERAFWTLVRNDTPPAADGADATTGALETIYAGTAGGEIELCGREAQLAQYEALRQLKKETETKQKQIAQTLMQDLGAHESGVCGGFRVTWKPQSRSSFDAARFTQEHPEIDLSAYSVPGTSRVFRVGKAEEEPIPPVENAEMPDGGDLPD